MLATSLGLGHAGPLLEHWYLRDYWQPEYLVSFQFGGLIVSLEDYLFAFAFSGIAVVAFQVFHSRTRRPSMTIPAMVDLVLKLQGVLAVWLAGLVIGILVFGLNSVTATAILCLAGGCVVLAYRRHWCGAAVWSAVAASLIFWLSYKLAILPLYEGLIEAWWAPSIIDGTLIAGVPIEELVWAAAMTFFLGTVTQFHAETEPLRVVALHAEPGWSIRLVRQRVWQMTFARVRQ